MKKCRGANRQGRGTVVPSARFEGSRLIALAGDIKPGELLTFLRTTSKDKGENRNIWRGQADRGLA